MLLVNIVILPPFKMASCRIAFQPSQASSGLGSWSLNIPRIKYGSNSLRWLLPLVTEFAEPDSFYCFMHLMSEIRDFFIKTLDESAVGIGWFDKIPNESEHVVHTCSRDEIQKSQCCFNVQEAV